MDTVNRGGGVCEKSDMGLMAFREEPIRGSGKKQRCSEVGEDWGRYNIVGGPYVLRGVFTGLKPLGLGLATKREDMNRCLTQKRLGKNRGHRYSR